MAFSTQQVFSPFHLLNNKVTALIHNIDMKESEMQKAEHDLESIPEVFSKNVEYEESLQNLTIHQLADKYERSQQLLAEKCCEIRELTSAYASLQSEYNDFFVDSRDHEEDKYFNHEQILVANSELKHENSVLRESISKLVHLSEKKIAEIEALSTVHDSLKRDMDYLVEVSNGNEARVLVERLSKDVDELRDRVAVSNRKELDIRSKYEQLLDQKSSLIKNEMRLEAAENAIQSYENDIGSFVSQIQLLKSEISKKNELLLEARSHFGLVETLEMKMTALEEKCATQLSIERVVHEKHSVHEELLQEIRSAIHFTMMLLQEGVRVNDNLKKDIGDLKHQITAKEICDRATDPMEATDEDIARNCCEALQSENDKLLRKVIEDEKLIIELESQIANFTASESSENEELLKKDRKLKSLEAHIATITASTSFDSNLEAEYRAKLAHISSENETIICENQELRERLEECAHTIEHLREKMQINAIHWNEKEELQSKALGTEMSKQMHQARVIDELTVKLSNYEMTIAV